MNLAEKLAREISRVTALRCRYESLRGIGNVNVEPAILLMTVALEAAMKAAGENCAITQIDASKGLEGFTKASARSTGDVSAEALGDVSPAPG